MSIRKQSPYGPFVQRVLLPTLRIGTILLALLAICLASWLETNESFDSCSFKSSMALHQVFLFRNITSNLTTPDSVSFGLWKHCYVYALNCSCTPTNLNYQPDVSTILQVATEHNAIAPLGEGTSLSRIIPLIMASTFSGIALLLGLWANRPKKYIYRRITAGFILATMILVAYGFLSAYDQYFQKIKEACRNPNNNVLCARHAVQIEAVIFSMALALLFIGLILWIILSFFNNDEKEEEYIAQFYDEEEEEEEEDWNGSHDTKTSPSKQTVDPIPSPGLSSQGYYPPDEMVAWRDVSLFKEDATFEKQKNKGGREHAQEKSTTHARGNCISRGAAAGTNYPSIGPNEKPSLPPPPTATIKPTVQNTSPTRPLATKLAGLNSSFKNKRASSSSRKASHDSAHTFGGSKSPRRRSQGSPLAEFPEERSSNKTPTSMSPHPFPSPLDQKDPQSLYSLDNNSSSNSNSSGYFGIKPGHVPVLNMPPTGFVEHPLNKKIITDKRIQTYLQSKE